jgi:hypothetical protein
MKSDEQRDNDDDDEGRKIWHIVFVPMCKTCPSILDAACRACVRV